MHIVTLVCPLVPPSAVQSASGTLRKDMCTDTDAAFSGYSRMGVVKMNGYTMNMVRKS